MINDVIETLIETREQGALISSYTVDALLEKLGVTANIKIWKSIDSIINVQGVVSKVKPYGRVAYFELVGGNFKISVKCPIEIRPREGDNIIVEGIAVIKPSRFNTGLDIVLDGKPVALVNPPPIDETVKPNLKKDSFLKLHDYLENHSLRSFCLLGTETAIRDALSQMHPEVKMLVRTQVIRVSEKSAMLSDLYSALQSSDSFAIVRGGDDISLGLWNDPDVISDLLAIDKPFYIALGHTHFVPLVNQFADESFHTPTDLGKTIDGIINRLINESSLRSEFDTLKKDHIILDKNMAVLREKEKNDGDRLRNMSLNLQVFEKRYLKQIKVIKILSMFVLVLALSLFFLN